jgi:hypothetical protein
LKKDYNAKCDMLSDSLPSMRRKFQLLPVRMQNRLEYMDICLFLNWKDASGKI